MKKLILFSSVLLLTACIGPQQKKQYDFELIHTNGDTVETSYVGVGDNLFSLNNGDFKVNGESSALVSGVRSFKVLRIKNLGMQSAAEADNCDCELKLVTNE